MVKAVLLTAFCALNMCPERKEKLFILLSCEGCYSFIFRRKFRTRLLFQSYIFQLGLSDTQWSKSSFFEKCLLGMSWVSISLSRRITPRNVSAERCSGTAVTFPYGAAPSPCVSGRAVTFTVEIWFPFITGEQLRWKFNPRAAILPMPARKQTTGPQHGNTHGRGIGSDFKKQVQKNVPHSASLCSSHWKATNLRKSKSRRKLGNTWDVHVVPTLLHPCLGL